MAQEKFFLLILNKRKGGKKLNKSQYFKNITHAEICNRKIQQNQNSTDFMSP